MNEREIATVCAQLGRRQILKAFAGAVGGVALTACGGGGGVSATTATFPDIRTDGITSAGSGAARTPPASEPASAAEPAQTVSTNTENKLFISLPVGSQTNYPLQFGRAFPRGAISGAPSVALDGVTLALQQADIKTRYPDGSVKFAVISVVIPTLGSAERMLSITNTAVGAAPAAETRANMLANYDFEATINVAVGGTPVAGAPVSARAMLTALTDAGLSAETAAGGVNSRYWTVGPVCTTVLLCDHTTKAWDIGTNATRAIRPMFHVQFWPSIGKYHVRHILEVADVTKLKDETGLDVTFTTGQAAPVARLTQSGVGLYLATFQTRAYWGGTAVPRANVKHGVGYMASTMALPNFDSRITANAAAIASYATDWAGRSKALGANGYWTKSMAATGGRPDLGLIPKWEVLALYSGAAHMHEMTERHAEMTGSWRFFMREGSGSKTVFGATNGQGRVLSKLSRPTQWLGQGMNGSIKTGVDGFTIDGTILPADGWAEDSAHTPGVFWFSYLTTGEAIWHEKLLQMAAWSLFIVNPGIGYNSVGNGASSSAMILNGLQSRAWGWQYRNRARAWWATIDGSGEQSLFQQSLSDAAAQRYGLYGIAGAMLGDPIRETWNINHRTWYGPNTPMPRPNALNYWEGKGVYTQEQAVSGWGVVPNDWGGGAQAPWMRNFITMCLFHAVELGVTQAKTLADWSALQTIEVAAGPQPLRIAQYITPDIKSDGSYYQTLTDLYDGWASPINSQTIPSMGADSSVGLPGSGSANTMNATFERYGSIAAAAIAIANGASRQAAAWSFVSPYHANTVFYDHDPRYAIVPR